MRLADGVSFVHLSLADTPDGSNPLPGMTAFQKVGRDSRASCLAAMPLPTSSRRIDAAASCHRGRRGYRNGRYRRRYGCLGRYGRARCARRDVVL